MGRYSANRAMLDTQPIVVLDADNGRRASIACHGAALLNLELPHAGTPLDVAWGYRNDAETVARAGSHFAILAPFGGRVADARYRLDGQTRDLQPGVTGKHRGFRHGFVRDADFTDSARRIAVPTLCVVGDQDGSTPPDLVRSLAGLIPGARFEVIRNAAHIPCIEQPEALVTLIRDFVASLPEGKPAHG